MNRGDVAVAMVERDVVHPAGDDPDHLHEVVDVEREVAGANGATTGVTGASPDLSRSAK